MLLTDTPFKEIYFRKIWQNEEVGYGFHKKYGLVCFRT